MRQILIALLMVLPLVTNAGEQLSQKDYKMLMKAFSFIEAGQYSEAHAQLISAKGRVGSDYALALVAHNLGQVELQRERYSQALAHLREAYELKALPDDQQINLIRTLAQLNCMEERWKACIAHLEHWMAQQPDSVKGDDYLLQAQAYSRLDSWSKVVTPISKAIASRNVAPESWYQLKVVAHIRQSQWRAAIQEQKRMISHYAGKPGHWRQLVSLHLQNKDQKSALADQRIAFERGLLTKHSDYRLLAHMMLQAQIPYYAGQVVEQGMARGILKQDKKTLQLLSRCWVQAKENEKAVQVLAQLNKLAPSKQSLTQLAQVQIDLQDWHAAQRTLLQALQNDQGKQARLQLLLGITRIKLKRYDRARQALAAAAGDKQLRSTVDGWMQYLDRIHPKQALTGTS